MFLEYFCIAVRENYNADSPSKETFAIRIEKINFDIKVVVDSFYEIIPDSEKHFFGCHIDT